MTAHSYASSAVTALPPSLSSAAVLRLLSAIAILILEEQQRVAQIEGMITRRQSMSSSSVAGSDRGLGPAEETEGGFGGRVDRLH